MAATQLPELVAALIAEVAERKVQHQPGVAVEDVLSDVTDTVCLTLAVYDPELFGRYLAQMAAQMPDSEQVSPVKELCDAVR